MATPTPYFRSDQSSGISPPDLSKDVSFAEHIVRARGKRTQFTSVSLDRAKIADFGDCTYQLNRPQTDDDGHEVIEHRSLLQELQDQSRSGERASRDLALRAVRYACRRLEGLVRWRFDTRGVERKDLITFAGARVQNYFTRV